MHRPIPVIRLFLAAIVLAPCLRAAEAASTPAVTNTVSNLPRTSMPSASGLAPWQERLTVGPGDSFDVSVYGQPDSQKPLVIGPDGRINYLQAVDVEVTGLTIDEMRTRIEDKLKPFNLSPRVIVVPTGIRSKKYYMLGNVVQRGVFTLERPITILEAVARAKGFTSGGNRNSFTLIDMEHAFLVRRQPSGDFARETIDFEALFSRGDLGQNKQLAPDDYLYFPPLGMEEVYVLGEAKSPGIVPYSKDLTVLGAVAAKGGFTDAAFRKRILVVRGSLDHPESYVIDLSKVLRAANPDFRLQARDIVYVSKKPWAKAEELLKAAASDFVRAVAVTWEGREIGTLIK